MFDDVVAQNRNDSIKLNRILLVLRRRLGMLFLCLLLGLGLSYLFLSFVALKYKASAQLIFEPGAEQVVTPEQNLPSTINSARALERVIALIESPSILKQVAQLLIADPTIDRTERPVMTAIERILADPLTNDEVRARRLVWQMQRDLSVKSEAAQQLVTVDYQSKNPKEAADVANMIVKAFMRDRTASRQAVVAEATRWLDERLADLREKLNQADQNLEIYKAKHRLDNEAQAAIAGIQLRELQREREAIKTLYESMLAKVSQTTAQQTLVSSEFRVLVDASPPERPKLAPMLVWIGGALGGLFLGITLIALLEYFNDKIIDLQELEKKLSVRVLARVPVISGSDFTYDATSKNREGASRYLNFAKEYPNSLFTDSMVKVNVAIADGESSEARKIVMITSSMPGEGKTQISANLAGVSALLGDKTLLIDLDVRKEAPLPANGAANGAAHSKLAAFLDSAGLTEFVHSTAESDDYDVIRPKPCEGAVWLALLRPQMSKLLDYARATYDRVWIDTAPAQVFTDANILARHIDGVLIVAEWSKTTVRELRETCAIIKSGGGDIVGVIVNKVKVDRLVSAAMASYKDYYAGLKRRYAINARARLREKRAEAGAKIIALSQPEAAAQKVTGRG